MDSAEIRQRFLTFFAERGHLVVPSAPLVVDDPTLLFVNAGMVPFKPYFLGEAVPPSPRATSVQKCVRTLDIDEVGKTTRHASFFQMCGNFSFGDYFKEQAIPLAWELLTRPVADGGFGFPEARLWPTVYEDDDEAADLWQRVIGVPAERIQRRGKADNFWSMGVPGPCGPCSEIYYDRGAEHGRDGGPVADEDRYLEVWNLVFMQFERGAGTGKDDYPIYGELPAKNIDTGMGLERMATLLQGVDNLYEIDTTRVILDRAMELSGARYGVDRRADVGLRVVADHSRTCAFLVADGVLPGNEGRGYVLRRLMRRVIRTMRLLGATEPTMGELAAAAIAAMGPQYPELVTDAARITAAYQNEEQAFLATLRTGTAIFDTAVTEVKRSGATVLPGDKAFALHDTYGFPIDLTLEMAAEQGISVDEAGFRQLMTEQRSRAKADSQARKAGLADTTVYRDVLDAHGTTDWLAYEGLETDASVVALLSAGQPVPALGAGEIGTAFLDRTTFYAESGGQHADAGTIVGDGVTVEVLDVQRPVRGLVAHQVRVTRGELVVGQQVQAKVDARWRHGARQAHSGTHVVHAALREVLGPQALQAGSFNRPGYLRLDFSWTSALSKTSRGDIEHVSNRAVRDDLPVSVAYMSLQQAQDFGALALFGETYGETVRVVEIGGPWSRELCGGTHVSASSQIGPLAVTAESSVGSGVRRIEAVVGLPAYEYLARERDLVGQLSDLLKVPPAELPGRIEGMMSRLRDAEREVTRLRQDALAADFASIVGEGVRAGKVTVWAFTAPAGTDGGTVRDLVLRARGEAGAEPAAVLGAAVSDGKVALVAAVNPGARDAGITARELLAAALPAVAGRGGGKDDVAQGGGTDPAGVAAALRAAVDLVTERTGG
ncbi:MAG: alanine--tRNA ligase [Actinomycetota bacterium]|nr:MAG: alanine--tRNA ligase [Actinomycetota bacterium]